MVSSKHSMCPRAARVLRSQSGETIVETLVAVLICSFALFVLFTAVSVAGRINAEANDAYERSRQSADVAESQEGGDPSMQRTVEVDGVYPGSYLVYYYSSDADSAPSYRYVPGQGRWPV